MPDKDAMRPDELLARDIDPADSRKAQNEVLAKEAETFEVIAKEWMS